MSATVHSILLSRKKDEVYEYKRLELRRQNLPVCFDLWELAWCSELPYRDYSIDDKTDANISQKQIKPASQYPPLGMEPSSEKSIFQKAVELVLDEEVKRLDTEGFTVMKDTRLNTAEVATPVAVPLGE